MRGSVVGDSLAARRTHEELERTRQRAHEISCRADQVIKKYGELGESSHR